MQCKGKAKMSFHQLLSLLWVEAEISDLNVSLISEHKLKETKETFSFF